MILQIWLYVGSDQQWVWAWTGVLAGSVVVAVLLPMSSRVLAVQALLVVGVSLWAIADVRFSTVGFSMWILAAVSQVPSVLGGRRRSHVFTAASVVGLVVAGVWGGQPMRNVLPLAGLVGVSGVLMTAFYHSETSIRRANSRMLALFEAIGDAVVVTDHTQRIRFANEAAVQLFGYEHEGLIGESLGALVPDRFSDSHAQQHSDFLPSDRLTLSGDREGLSGRRKSGEEFPAAVSVSKMETEGQLFAVAIIRDLSERATLVESLQDRETKLEATVKELQAIQGILEATVMDLQASQEARSRLIASVAHELRTPLTAVVGYAALLVEDLNVDAETRSEFHRTIAREATDLTGIVEDLLTGARLEVDRLSVRNASLQVGPLVRAVADEQMFLHGGTIPVSGAARALGDPLRIRQIVRNLLTNARLHGGEAVEVIIQERSGSVNISILDNGAGVKEKDRERIFKPFETAHAIPGMAPSLGLGLSLSRTLAELMGGELTYAHEQGRSSFTLTLQTA